MQISTYIPKRVSLLSETRFKNVDNIPLANLEHHIPTIRFKPRRSRPRLNKNQASDDRLSVTVLKRESSPPTIGLLP